MVKSTCVIISEIALLHGVMKVFMFTCVLLFHVLDWVFCYDVIFPK